MNRNQRRLGRMHQQNTFSDHENNNKQERQQRLKKSEIQERTYRKNKEERDRNTERSDNQDFNKVQDWFTDLEKQNKAKWGPNVERRLIERNRHNRSTGIEEILLPRGKRNPKIADRFAANKCCYTAPRQEDFGQLTDTEVVKESSNKFRNIIKEQYDFNQLIPETINQRREVKKMIGNNAAKVEIRSQLTCDKNLITLKVREDKSPRKDAKSVDEFEDRVGEENIYISETPRIKIIVKKFSRFRKNNLELRKLEEKVVCVEYDVFLGEVEKPRQKLRAFFSIKPTYEENERLHEIPSTVKNNFNISEFDLNQLNEKEIEIIDGKISENKAYLEDLKRILRRKQSVNAKKNKDALDLMSLYEMAKRESRFSNSFLTKEELKEMKHLILNNCASSVQGICRRTVKNLPGVNTGVLSQSIMSELLREN